MQTIRMMPCIARFFTAAALMSLFSHLVVSKTRLWFVKIWAPLKSVT
jgi:hypothetical protein